MAYPCVDQQALVDLASPVCLNCVCKRWRNGHRLCRTRPTADQSSTPRALALQVKGIRALACVPPQALVAGEETGAIKVFQWKS
jgi:hypothetical protein